MKKDKNNIKKENKKENNIKKALYRFLIIFLLALVCCSVSIRIMGYMPYAIKTQSMEPELSANDLVYVKRTDFNKIETGDIITYVVEDGIAVTHRVYSIDTKDNKIYTKGDNNEYPDAMPVDASQIIGEVAFSIPFAGAITNFIKK